MGSHCITQLHVNYGYIMLWAMFKLYWNDSCSTLNLTAVSEQESLKMDAREKWKILVLRNWFCVFGSGHEMKETILNSKYHCCYHSRMVWRSWPFRCMTAEFRDAISSGLRIAHWLCQSYFPKPKPDMPIPVRLLISSANKSLTTANIRIST